MLEILETKRLILRPFKLEDADTAFRWFGDGEVMRLTPTGPDRSVEDTRSRLATYCAHQATHGFSKWLARERRSGEAVGDSGLLVLQESGDIDLGFRFLKCFWGLGFATEAAAAWVDAAFTAFGLKRLTAFSHPENAASLRVLEKIGFRRLERKSVMGMEAIFYALSQVEYQNMR